MRGEAADAGKIEGGGVWGKTAEEVADGLG